MSLYNMLFEVNAHAGLLLSMLGVRQAEIPRFRDVYLEGQHIVVFTRTGGGNREFYKEQNNVLRALPGYVSDADDSLDATYAHFRYAVAAKYHMTIEILREEGAQRNPTVLLTELLSKLNDTTHRDDPDVLAALSKMGPLIEKMKKVLE